MNEIVSTYDQAQDVIYTYILTSDKMREEKLESAFKILEESHNVKRSNNPMHKLIVSNTIKRGERIEEHPAFGILMSHEASGCHHFHRWVNEDKHTKGIYGFARLKNKVKNSFLTTTRGIYVLRIANRPKPFFYVGKAINIEHRIQQHRDGTGAFCISGEPFERVDPVTKGMTSVSP